MQANQHPSLASPPSVSLVRTYTPSNAIDLTQEDDGPEPSRQIKRPRIDHNIDLTSPINSPPRSTSSLAHFSAHNEPVFSKPLVTDSRATSFSSRPIQSREAFTPFCNTSIATNSKPNLQTTTSLNPSLAGPPLTNGSHHRERGLQQNRIIDLTTSPSPPPQSQQAPPPAQHYPESHMSSRPDMLSVPPKTPVCIGQLSVTALILYPVNYLKHPNVVQNPLEAEWGTVRLQYDPTQREAGGDETIQIRTPSTKGARGEVILGDSFGVVEQKVATVLGPMLGKGLVRLDARVRRGNPGAPILPLCILVHTPNGNIPIVSRYLSQFGLLLDHPSQVWEPQRIQQFLYLNPHNPPPGGHARALNLGPSRLASSGIGGNRWSASAVATKSVEIQRSQVDEVFKSLRGGDDLEETDPGPDIGTRLYPHQKKALTFLLERENELRGSGGKTYSLWKPQRNGIGITWINLVTQREISTEPKECKGTLLADDMGLGKTITCVSLIACTLSSAREFSEQPLPQIPKPPLEHRSSEPSLNASHFSGMVWGMPDRAGISTSGSSKQRARAQKEQDKLENEYIRARRIKVRSRATLIVCPLSTVVNWEDQLREHWAGTVQVVGGAGSSCNLTQSTLTQLLSCGAPTYEFNNLSVTGDEGAPSVVPIPTTKPPPEPTEKRNALRVYVYHGNTRRPDPKFLADFDAVITTYATLASEYSKQTKSVIAQELEDEDDDSEETNADSFATEYDDNGNVIIKIPKAKEKKGIKRKKNLALLSGVAEATSPLQSIHWFRVVLDEAHSIKETSTVASRASCDLEADRRLCLTGTPVQNKLDDVYALIKFLRLSPFEDKSVWQEFIGTPVKFGQPLGVARLQTIMKSITLRRTKETKAENGRSILALPPRRDELRLLKFDAQEQQIYNDFFQESRDEFKELSHKNEVMKNYVGILQKILRLRQICDHFELVDGKGPSDSEFNYEEIIEAIAKEGINISRASAIFSLIRDSGTAQCAECGCDLGTPQDAAQKEMGMDVEGAVHPKRGRKSKSTSRAPTRQSSPTNHRPILSRCQHLFCFSCFQNNVFPRWPAVDDDTLRECTVCKTQLRPSDAVEVNPDCTFGDTVVKKKPVKKEKRQKGVNLENFHPSTKIKALLNDLVGFSRMNPYSQNYDPSSIEIQMVDEHGNQVDDGVIKTVVFSQWTTMLDKIEDALEVAGIQYDRLDGTMKRDERTRAMDSLKNNPACEVLLVSLKAGGVGLNLTAAQRVYLMDPYWNPAVENQAVDRIHRLGQTRPVTTVKLIIENTIEARLLEVQQKKTELANMTLGTHLSKAEVHQRRMEELNQLFHE